MKFHDVKTLFLVEFGRHGMDAYTLRNTWITFVNDLFDCGEINGRVYEKCLSIA